MLKRVYTYFAVFLAIIVYGIGISLLLDPNRLAPGGVSGIGIMLNSLIGIPVGVVMFVLNIPLLIASFIKIGKPFFFKTLLILVLTTISIDTMAIHPPLTKDPILAAVFGGLSLAFSMGIILKAGGSTGGTDIIVKLLKLKYPYIATGKLFLMLDAVIVTMSAFVFGKIESALYSAIVIFVSSYFLDIILYGSNSAILMFIVSEKTTTIVDRLLIDLDIGATCLSGYGSYTNSPRDVVMCGVKKHMYPKVEDIIYETDENAFVIISSAKEIMGLGFNSHFAPKI